jgi:MoaA/NifB/PqqE/SkfB family radical SAM enzyme
MLQEIAFKTKASFGKPTYVILLLTNRCNAQCLHCHSWKLRSVDEELTTNDWHSVINQLRKWLGPIYIAITGGEILLRNDAIQLAEHCSSLGFSTEFLTNGFLLKSERARQLIQSGIKRITISLDGSRPETHNLIRGRRGFFERVTESLRMLVHEKAERGEGPVITAKTTIMSHNVDELSDIARFVREIGLDGVEYQSIESTYYSEQLTDVNWYVNNPLWISDHQRIARSIDRLKAMRSEGFPILNTLENLDMICSYFRDPQKLAYKVHAHEYGKKKPECRSWIGGLQVMPNGGLKMCHFMQPFDYTRNGNIKSLWKQRKQCWKESCKYAEFL